MPQAKLDLSIQPAKPEWEKNENKFPARRQVKSFEAKDFVRRTINPSPAIPIGIVVLDSGIDHRHSALNTMLWTAREKFSIKIDGAVLDFPKGSFGFDAFNVEDKNKRGFPHDADNHGTMVAGIIGADETGIARFDDDFLPVQLLAVKTFASKAAFENTAGENTRNIIRSLDFILEAKRTLKRLSNPIDLRIVNMSFGFYRRKNPKFSAALAGKIKELCKEGILVVASTGNSGRNLDESTPEKDVAYYPAGVDCDGLIAVAAINQSGELLKNSNFVKKAVHLAAPGERIYTTKINNQFAVVSGTSLAAPFVSAAAALLLLVKPEMKNTDLKKCLLENADKNPALNVESGGRLDIYQSLLNIS